MMPIKSWQAVLLPAAISFVLVAAEIPPGTWFTTAAISLASGVTERNGDRPRFSVFGY